jgi:hypothetical protein
MDDQSSKEVVKQLKSVADCLRVLCLLAIVALVMWYLQTHH